MRLLELPALKSTFAEIHTFEQLKRALPVYSEVSLVVRRNSIAGSIVGFKLPLLDPGYLGVVGAVVGICHGIRAYKMGYAFAKNALVGTKW